MSGQLPYTIFPLGDEAITIDFGNVIDEQINRKVISLLHQLQNHPPYGMIEAVPAYSSLTVFYDLFLIKQKISNQGSGYEFMKQNLEKLLANEWEEIAGATDLVSIPVCYDAEFGPDLKWIASQKNISVEALINIHCEKNYRVFMLGFLPGFAYMGEVNEQIVVPRKPQPEKVLAGSVGLAGKQTGIYPFDSPGGWQIIGRTPTKMFDVESAQPCLLKAGGNVKFYPITRNEFEHRQGRNS